MKVLLLLLLSLNLLSAHGVGVSFPIWFIVLVIVFPFAILFLLVYKWKNKIIRYIILTPIVLITLISSFNLLIETIKHYKCEKSEKITKNIIEEYKNKFSINYSNKEKDLQLIANIKKYLLKKSSFQYSKNRYICNIYDVSDAYCGASEINEFIGQRELGLMVFQNEQNSSKTINFETFYKKNSTLFTKETNYLRFFSHKDFRFNFRNDPIIYLRAFQEKNYKNAFLLFLKMHEHDYFRVENNINRVIFETALLFDKETNSDKYMSSAILQKSYCEKDNCSIDKLNRSYKLLKNTPKVEFYMQLLIKQLNKEFKNKPITIHYPDAFCPIYHYLKEHQNNLYRDVLLKVENLDKIEYRCRKK